MTLTKIQTDNTGTIYINTNTIILIRKIDDKLWSIFTSNDMTQYNINEKELKKILEAENKN